MLTAGSGVANAEMQVTRTLTATVSSGMLNLEVTGATPPAVLKLEVESGGANVIVPDVEYRVAEQGTVSGASSIDVRRGQTAEAAIETRVSSGYLDIGVR